MMTGRLLIMLVVMASFVATGRPALASPETAATQQGVGRSWTQRLNVGRSFTRIALLQRVTLRSPTIPVLTHAEHSTRAITPIVLDAFRFCLPPPTV